MNSSFLKTKVARDSFKYSIVEHKDGNHNSVSKCFMQALIVVESKIIPKPQNSFVAHADTF